MFVVVFEVLMRIALIYCRKLRATWMEMTFIQLIDKIITFVWFSFNKVSIETILLYWGDCFLPILISILLLALKTPVCTKISCHPCNPLSFSVIPCASHVSPCTQTMYILKFLVSPCSHLLYVTVNPWISQIEALNNATW